jgi:predicted phage terminase large subunit-like protein
MKKKTPRAKRSAKSRSVLPRRKPPTVDNYPLAAMIRQGDFLFFVQQCFRWLFPGRELQMNRHIRAIVYQLELVMAGKVKQLTINLPPRHLKSFLVSIALPAYLLGRDPTKRIILVTYGSDLSANFANQLRAILNAPEYKAAFPNTRISRGKNTESEIATTRSGFYLATSIDGSLTGRGGDIVIVDDPLKASDAQSKKIRERVNKWYYDAVTRLDDKKNGAFIITMQRLDIDDLCGTRLRSEPGEWTHLKLSAIAERDERIQIGESEYWERAAGEALHPEREPLEALKRLQTDRRKWLAQYQQNPPLPGDPLVTPEMVGRYDRLPVRTSSSWLLQSWDPAAKTGEGNDRSACTMWLVVNGDYYLMRARWGRFDYPRLREVALEEAKKYRPDKILIESNGVGESLFAELKKARLPVVEVRPEKDKVTRMAVQAGKFASRHVFFPRRGRGLAEVEAEFFAFPYGAHDDLVDSISQALAYELPTSKFLWNDDRSNAGFAKFNEGMAIYNAFRNGF